jgi:prenyltransferase beta subunit
VICCQEGTGGLKDKPMKNPDFYHTSYASSGMSISQHKADYLNLHSPDAQTDSFDGTSAKKDDLVLLSGIESNRLRRIHPVFNARYDYIASAKAFYRDKLLKEVTELK